MARKRSAPSPEVFSRQTRRHISDDEAAALALSRYGSRPPRSLDALAEETGRDPAVISRTIARALRDGLVEVILPRRLKPPERKTELERRLLERHGTLSTCIVLESGPLSSPQENDTLHQQLGGAMASLIGSGTLFRDGDVIGLGSGRGVYYTINCLASYPALRAKVTLCSLTGEVYARDHSEQINLLLDADIHLGLLGLCFSRPVTLHPVSHSIVCADPEEARRVREQTRPGDSVGSVTHALVGVGVLTHGHRFYKEVKTQPARRSRLLRPIEKPLEQLVSICDEVGRTTGELYWPVADLANRLFFVPPPARLRMSASARTELEERVTSLISEINARLVTIGDEELRSTADIMLVAGSRPKAGAIRKLLADGYPIRFLCTDQQIAEELVGD